MFYNHSQQICGVGAGPDSTAVQANMNVPRRNKQIIDIQDDYILPFRCMVIYNNSPHAGYVTVDMPGFLDSKGDEAENKVRLYMTPAQDLKCYITKVYKEGTTIEDLILFG